MSVYNIAGMSFAISSYYAAELLKSMENLLCLIK